MTNRYEIHDTQITINVFPKIPKKFQVIRSDCIIDNGKFLQKWSYSPNSSENGTFIQNIHIILLVHNFVNAKL